MSIKRGITVSFKNITKDLELYNLLINMEDRGTEIKKILYRELILKSKDVSDPGKI